MNSGIKGQASEQMSGAGLRLVLMLFRYIKTMKGWYFEMLESIIKNYDELPLFLNAKNLSKVLGLSESSVYELMHEKGFPSICIGSRLVVPKEHFKKWVDEQIEKKNRK